jgi:hypothetical protein
VEIVTAVREPTTAGLRYVSGTTLLEEKLTANRDRRERADKRNPKG